MVDEETHKNNLDIVRDGVKVTKQVPIESVYDFSFAKKANRELTQAGWSLREFLRGPCRSAEISARGLQSFYGRVRGP